MLKEKAAVIKELTILVFGTLFSKYFQVWRNPEILYFEEGFYNGSL